MDIQFFFVHRQKKRVPLRLLMIEERKQTLICSLRIYSVFIPLSAKRRFNWNSVQKVVFIERLTGKRTWGKGFML